MKLYGKLYGKIIWKKNGLDDELIDIHLKDHYGLG